MNTLIKLSLAAFLLVGVSVPAMAGVTVNSPSNGADVSAPFTLSATGGTCSSQNVTAMGYSFDSSSSTTTFNTSNLDVSVSVGTGSHTLHVKAWGAKGASCVADININVSSDAGSSGASVPSNATTVSSLQSMNEWRADFDSGTGSGTASGDMALTSSPSYAGTARSFYTKYSDYGGLRYSISFGDDENALNFLYDGWVFLTGSQSTIANLEMDLNQVMANGQTVIFGMQCDGWSGTWDYTKNGGSVSKPKDTWVHSGAKCNPRSWAANVWHHVQFSYSRTTAGEVTYHSVWLDGVEQGINATVPSAFALGWGPTLLTNFQVDGATKGASTSLVYLDALKISRW
jgi:hypothetical protein